MCTTGYHGCYPGMNRDEQTWTNKKGKKTPPQSILPSLQKWRLIKWQPEGPYEPLAPQSASAKGSSCDPTQTVDLLLLLHVFAMRMILFTGGDVTRLLWGDVTQYLYNALKIKSAKYCYLRWQQNKTKYGLSSCSSQIHFQLIFLAGIQNQSKNPFQLELFSLMGKLERNQLGFK